MVIDNILFISLIISCILAGYVTFKHIILKNPQTCYDNWLFPVLLAMVFQMIENKCR